MLPPHLYNAQKENYDYTSWTIPKAYLIFKFWSDWICLIGWKFNMHKEFTVTIA